MCGIVDLGIWTCSSFIFLAVAFQLLDTDQDGYLSYSELFSLLRMVTGPLITDDHLLGMISSILNRSELQQTTRLTFDEFTNVSQTQMERAGYLNKV